MTKITLQIDPEIERNFRLAVAKKLGGRKGDLSKAAEEAIVIWTKNVTA